MITGENQEIQRKPKENKKLVDFSINLMMAYIHIHPQCNEFTGKCACKPKRGGRRCSECEDYHWGDPTKDECEPCQCDPSGSTDLQCHRQTGYGNVLFRVFKDNNDDIN